MVKSQREHVLDVRDKLSAAMSLSLLQDGGRFELLVNDDASGAQMLGDEGLFFRGGGVCGG